MGCLVKERENIYRKHAVQPQYQQLVVEKYFHTCGDGNFHIFPFFQDPSKKKT